MVDFQVLKPYFEALIFQTVHPKNPELQQHTRKYWARSFRGWFRTDAHSVAINWMKLAMHGIMIALRKEQPVHLMLVFLPLQSYVTKQLLCTKFGCFYQKMFWILW